MCYLQCFTLGEIYIALRIFDHDIVDFLQLAAGGGSAFDPEIFEYPGFQGPVQEIYQRSEYE